MGSQIEMEKYSGSFRAVLNGMVFAIHKTIHQIKIR